MTNSKNPTSPVHHYVRTIFAALFGMLALVLILASILVVWANRTLTDTATYTQAVAPLISQPAVQDFVAEKVTDQLVKSAPTEDLANTLLPPEQVAGKTPEQLAAAVKPVVHDSVVQILASPRIAELWKTTNQTDHAQLIQQLDANAPKITLDLGPLVTGVLAELKQTKLAPIAGKIDLPADKAKLDLKGSLIEKIHKFYEIFKTATLAVVVVTLVATGLCVLISVHHAKTLRRMVAGTGIIALLIAGLIALPSGISLSGDDPVMQKAVLAAATTLLHNLQLACLIIGAVCLVLAIGSKLYGMRKSAVRA